MPRVSLQVNYYCLLHGEASHAVTKMKKTPWFGGFRIDPWIQEYLAKTDMVPGKSDQDQVSREGVKPAAKKVLVHKVWTRIVQQTGWGNRGPSNTI